VKATVLAVARSATWLDLPYVVSEPNTEHRRALR
jgi:hypothetical protein